MHENAPGLYVCNKLCRDLRWLRRKKVKSSLEFCTVPLMRTLGEHYKGLLVQLAPSFAPTKDNIRRLRFLGHFFSQLRKSNRSTARLFVEFRHPGWCDTWKSVHAVHTFEKKANLSVVSIVSTGWNRLVGCNGKLTPTKTDYGNVWPPITRWTRYIRLHGEQSKYRGWYSPTKVKALIQPAKSCVISFNNTMWGRTKPRTACRWRKKRDGCAICNATQMAQELGVRRTG